MRLFEAFCDSLISLLITELQLLRVCNPLARSAGVFSTVFIGFLRNSGDFCRARPSSFPQFDDSKEVEEICNKL